MEEEVKDEKLIAEKNEANSGENKSDEQKKEDHKEPEKFNVILLYILIGLMILTGSMNTIFNKIIQKQDGCHVLFEQHHWIITFGMFIGELASLGAYAVVLYKRKKAQKEKDQNNTENNNKENGENAKLVNQSNDAPPPEFAKPTEGNEEAEKKDRDSNVDNSEKEEQKQKLPPVPTNLIFAISAMCDLTASTINTFGLTYLTTSMYQMMRGMELVFVCLWSKIFLKNHVYRHHITGIGTLLFGLFLVGLNSMLFKEKDKGVAKEPGIGIILMCISQLFSSTCYTVQEKFLKKYEINAFQLVGFEGLWGSVIYTIMLIIFQNCSCNSWVDTLKDGICFKDDKGNYLIEDTLFGFKQMGDNIALMINFICYIVSIALYNIVGINLTKLVSSTARAVIDTVRTVFIWLFFLCFEPVPNTGENFYALQFVGFLLLVFGSLLYNEIVSIPWFNLNYYTRENIRKRKIEELKLTGSKNASTNNGEDKLFESIDTSQKESNDNSPRHSDRNTEGAN